MLIWTRKIGEPIRIGESIMLTVVSLEPGKVRIGIIAPPSVRVDRSEIHALRAQGPTAVEPPTDSGNTFLPHH